MRPNENWRDTWGQIGIGACALLLPPLALGVAFYSMLDDIGPGGAQAGARVADTSRPAATVARSATVAAGAPGGHARSGRSVEHEARRPDRGGPAKTAPLPVPPVQITRITTRPAAAAKAAEGSAPPARKRVVRRRTQRQPQQEPFSLKNWLQQIGILPRDGNPPG